MKPFLAALALLVPLTSFAQQPPLTLPMPSAPSVAAKSWVLTDFNSGQVLLSQNPDMRIEPASLTKLMTQYLTFTALRQKQLTMTQVIPVSPRAWHAEGSRMFIEPLKPVTVDELIHGMIIQSGNDACIALAEAIAGSEDVFAEMMNREAARLGMKNTHFTNSTGLPNPQHYTTGYDLSLLAAALIRDFPEYYYFYSIKEYRYNSITQPNRNRLLWIDPYVDGMKTGHTDAAGFCLISSAKRGNRRLISVVLGAPSDSVRASESQKLLNFGFQFYDSVRLYAKDQSVATIPIWKGSAGTVKIGFQHDMYMTMPKGQIEKLKANLETQQPLLAPVSIGQKVGMLKLSVDNKLVAEYPVVALETVSTASMLGRGWDSIRLLFK